MTRKIRILVVEDEVAIREGLLDVFVYHGYDVDGTGDGQDGLGKALSGRYDLVLLDVMLPGVSGYEICDEIRKVDRDQPVIMLTARSSDDDIIKGLKLGADDYVAKPFSIQQLVLRVEAVLRRSKVVVETSGHIELADGIRVDTENLSGTRNDKPLVFTRREMDILQYLHAHTARPVSRDELLNKVWGYARNVGLETRTVDIHIAKLRRKVELDHANPRNLITVRGAGYRLVTDG